MRHGFDTAKKEVKPSFPVAIASYALKLFVVDPAVFLKR